MGKNYLYTQNCMYIDINYVCMRKILFLDKKISIQNLVWLKIIKVCAKIVYMCLKIIYEYTKFYLDVWKIIICSQFY